MSAICRAASPPAVAPTGLPGIGEHSREILTELGFAAEEIDGFIAAGVVAG